MKTLILLIAAAIAAAAAPPERVTICHIPPGNPDNPRTITVGAPAVAAHIRLHGDYKGPCRTTPPPEPPEELCKDGQVVRFIDDELRCVPPIDPPTPPMPTPPMPEPLAPTPPANVIEISRREDIKSCFMFSEVQEGDLIAITNLDRFIEGPCKATLYAGPARYRQEISSVARLTKGWLEAMAEFDGVIEIACPFEASAVQERKLTRGFAFREPEPCTRREF